MFALAGCLPDRLAYKYLPTAYNAGKFIRGGWIVVELKQKKDLTPDDIVSGELVSFQDHKLFILGTRQMNVIPDSSVHAAKLYMYKTQAGVFAILTIIGIIPGVIAAIAMPENATFFLMMGILPLVSGTVFTVTEATTRRNQLIFPEKNSLEDFIKFSRFPQGIPPGLDIQQLKLPELKQGSK